MLGDLERHFERFVDSAIARGFRLQVQPAEIGRQLEKAMLDSSRTSVGGAIAPNVFSVCLHPDDAAAFAGWSEALCQEMERCLADVAFRRGLITVAPMRVVIEADPLVRRRSVRTRAQFLEGATVQPEHAVHAVPLTLRPLDDHRAPHLQTRSRVTLGRATSNDFVLGDERVSRRHAMLEFIDGRWIISDLGSTNGTWVNGNQVDHARLVAGDELEVGGLRFRVELG